MLLTLNLTNYLHHLIVLMMTEMKVIGLCVDFCGTTIILLTKLASFMISSTHFKLSVRTSISNYKYFVHNLYTEIYDYQFLFIYLNSYLEVHVVYLQVCIKYKKYLHYINGNIQVILKSQFVVCNITPQHINTCIRALMATV